MKESRSIPPRAEGGRFNNRIAGVMASMSSVGYRSVVVVFGQSDCVCQSDKMPDGENTN